MFPEKVRNTLGHRDLSKIGSWNTTRAFQTLTKWKSDNLGSQQFFFFFFLLLSSPQKSGHSHRKWSTNTQWMPQLALFYWFTFKEIMPFVSNSVSSNLYHSIVFLYFSALFTEEGFLILLTYYSLELCIWLGIAFPFSLM